MKPILMIHDVTDEMFQLPLSQYTLTFDDGLYSQWAHIDRLLSIPTDKIFFISTGFMCNEKQSPAFPKSPVAHDKARSGILEDFMTVDQVAQLMSFPRCYVGGHGHMHIHLRSIKRMVDRISSIKQDTDQMMVAFDRNWGIRPRAFCYPYNESLDSLYPSILRLYGITEFYGRERIPIETLLRI